MAEFQDDCLESSELFDLNSLGAFFTWTNSQPRSPTLRKLDRALVNDEWMVKFPQSFATFDPPEDSDHSPCLVNFGAAISRKRKPFKFFTFFTSHQSYMQDLNLVWKGVRSQGSNMFLLAEKLKATKGFCRDLNRKDFGDIRSRAKLFEDETVARADWIFYSSAEESFLKQKSRIRWLNEGDANNKFFHRAVESNIAKSAIKYLRNSAGEKVTDHGQLSLLAVNYFKGLLGNSSTFVSSLSVNSIRSIRPFRCSNTLRPLLAAIPTSQEVQKFVFAMPKNKAPGPDGFPVEFFTHAWSIVGNDVIAAVLEFFSAKSLLKQFNATTICLVPKTPGVDIMSEFRPITCCNTIYKVISKILAHRIQLFLPHAVQNNQVGFVKGRLLCENVLLAGELVANFHKNGSVTQGCVKIDISKAYDSLDWKFTLNILRAFDIPHQLISWIRLCITSLSFSVAVNGDLEGYFQGKRGLRQGDPISSYLFVLAMDILAKKLDGMISSPWFKPHPSCTQPLVTHLSFADDVLIFFDGSESSLRVIMEVLEDFASCSGLRINPQKSTLLLNGNQPSITQAMAQKFNLSQGSLPLRYLGVPLTS